MSSAPTAVEIARDATWLAQALDPSAGTTRLVAMDRDSYRAASFLDDRLLQQTIDAQIVPWTQIEAALAGNLRQDARWIFHIGHVGSTLISRLLGALDGVLAVREPRLLRDLALSPADIRRRYVTAAPKLMSRTFAGEEIACVKATSFASEIATDLVPAGERALFIYASPRNYIASILAGENSLEELRRLADDRGQRMARRGIVLPPARNDADRAAAAWACEMTALIGAAAAMTDRRIEWADFDIVLSNAAAALDKIASFFGFAVDDGRIDAIVCGPIMRRYSKDPTYEYSPSLREQLIEQKIRFRGHEIDAALAMLRGASEKSPLLARAFSRAEG